VHFWPGRQGPAQEGPKDPNGLAHVRLRWFGPEALSTVNREIPNVDLGGKSKDWKPKDA